jgi:hypothetical protein
MTPFPDPFIFNDHVRLLALSLLPIHAARKEPLLIYMRYSPNLFRINRISSFVLIFHAIGCNPDSGARYLMVRPRAASALIDTRILWQIFKI